MKYSICIRWSIAFLSCFMFGIYLNVPAASAQNGPASQIEFGYAGSFQATSSGVAGEIPGLFDGQQVTNKATSSGGYRVGYSYLFNKWAGLDAGLDVGRYAQNFSGDIADTSVESTLHEITSNFVFRIPNHFSWLHPYALAGVGAMEFSPTDNPNNAVGSDSQFRSSLTYGAGVDFDISKRIGIRAEFRGAMFKTPSFNVPELTTNAETYISHPSIGIYFKLPGYSTGPKGD
jgi:opacity protein-like surface antigen